MGKKTVVKKKNPKTLVYWGRCAPLTFKRAVARATKALGKRPTTSEVVGIALNLYAGGAK